MSETWLVDGMDCRMTDCQIARKKTGDLEIGNRFVETVGGVNLIL
jgi:hypothetical protein